MTVKKTTTHHAKSNQQNFIATITCTRGIVKDLFIVSDVYKCAGLGSIFVSSNAGSADTETPAIFHIRTSNAFVKLRYVCTFFRTFDNGETMRFLPVGLKRKKIKMKITTKTVAKFSNNYTVEPKFRFHRIWIIGKFTNYPFLFFC